MSDRVATADLLETIVAATRRTVAARRERESIDVLERRASAAPRARMTFGAALADTDRVNVIAECKRRSPSKGVLRRDYDPVAIACEYAEAGAAAVSVLTEPSFFDGALEHLSAIRSAVDLPLLRKDFVVDAYQLVEARAAGADAVLLIVVALSQADLVSLHARATALGLDVLVEVHDGDEMERALDAGARIIGVNNRNLRTLAVDVGVSEALALRIPRHVTAVAESGLRSSDDLVRLNRVGYAAFLIGERLMGEEHPGHALKSLIDGAGGNRRSTIW